MKGALLVLFAVLGMGSAAPPWPALSAFLRGLSGGKGLFVPSTVAFGDSMTDTGNLFNLTNLTFPDPTVYFPGRFSNAFGTWLDAVRNTSRPYNANVTSLAYAGSTCCSYPNLVSSNWFGIPSMVSQVDAYINRSRRVKGKKVIVLWGGHNDVIGSFSLPPGEVPSVPKRVVGCLLSMADKLARDDKEATVLIASVAYLHTTPFLLGITVLKDMVVALNNAISVGTLALGYRYQGRVAYWDVNALQARVLASPASYGFKFVKVPCVKYRTSLAGLYNNYTLILESRCSNPDDYMYYDPLHLTSKAHGINALEYFKKLVDLNLITQLSGATLGNATVP